MIKNVLLTGDCHGDVETRLENISFYDCECKPEETAVIILGDAGINFWLNKTDIRLKKRISEWGYTIYCVRGNHEERPENIAGMRLVYDTFVQGEVWMEDEFPLIKYFVDGGEYNIKGYSCLVLGGAYSVDKYWRLERAKLSSRGHSGWFEGEQLTQEERDRILAAVTGREYDFVFSHTAPLDWEPVDLFLDCVDQSTVDKTMEIWLNEVRHAVNWTIWCFGHYHANRIERPHVNQFYNFTEEMDSLYHFWDKYDETGEIDYWMRKSPNFYQGE